MTLSFTSPPPTKWDLRYFRLAQFWANQCSKDPTTKVGAVIVGRNRRNMALGYNGFPSGLADLPERYDHRPTKYLYTQHAERNALDNATFDCSGGRLVSTMFPCAECVKSIISKGISCVVCPDAPPPIESSPGWRDHLELAKKMLNEASVRLVIVKEETP